MYRKELQELKNKAANREADSNDVLLIVAAAFESQTKHRNDVEASIELIREDLREIKSQIELLLCLSSSHRHITYLEEEVEDDDNDDLLSDNDEISLEGS